MQKEFDSRKGKITNIHKTNSNASFSFSLRCLLPDNGAKKLDRAKSAPTHTPNEVQEGLFLSVVIPASVQVACSKRQVTPEGRISHGVRPTKKTRKPSVRDDLTRS